MATKAWVELSLSGKGLDLEIRDNGVGFNIGRVDVNGSDRFGLKNMRERAEEVGAQFKIDTKIGEGTRIGVKLKLDDVELKL
jgi:signal transduction histidine kinase